MEIFHHDLATLFEQLGLPADKKSIEKFIISTSIPEGLALHEAEFWTPGQRQFLCEAISQDADWSEQIDMLSVLLRKER
ncbi:DUF2789 domain-containing protein [Parasalinivibrio latis]|uniref:DUF2789 domain-containing protein n=1 Tax=Parasalinivibrio latis TaxID=2952610 RepID=UPI0030E4E558